MNEPMTSVAVQNAFVLRQSQSRGRVGRMCTVQVEACVQIKELKSLPLMGPSCHAATHPKTSPPDVKAILTGSRIALQSEANTKKYQK